MQVREVMTPNLISVSENATLFDALRMLVERKVSALAVLDDKGVAVGVLSEGDLLRRAELGAEKRRPAWLQFLLGGGRAADEYVHSHGRKVSEIMTRGAFTIEAYAEIAEAVDQMIAHKVKRLIVVSDGRAVGVLSRSDVLKALLASLPAPGAPRTDAEIQADINAQFDHNSWAPRGGVRTHVESGIVTLDGAISDDRLRPALKVMIENIPGVKGVKDHLAWIEPNSGFLVPAEEDKG